MFKRLFLLLFIITTIQMTAQSYKLGFNSEFGMYNNVKPSGRFSGPYYIVPQALKLNFNTKFSNYANFDLRVGGSVEDGEYFYGWQFGAYYKPILFSSDAYGIVGINIFRNSGQGVYERRSIDFSDRLHPLLNIGVGRQVSKYLFIEILYQHNFSDGIASYEVTKDVYLTKYPLYFYSCVKFSLGFAWDL